MLELDLKGSQIDFYAFGGQKWLCGPEGTGALYISPTADEKLQTTFTGWRGLAGLDNNNALMLHADARRFEIASSSTSLQAGLRAALECHNDFAPARWIFEHILEMSHYLWQKLQDLSQAGFPIRCLSTVAPASGLVSFEVEHYDPVRLVRFLEVQGILTRFIKLPACIRACVHYLTTTDEIDELVAGIKLFVRSRS
jgi:L-cysteine/cystine lyase